MNRGGGGIKRRKGGAEKKRDKLKRALLSGGEKCAKLDVFFYLLQPALALMLPTLARTRTLLGLLEKRI